MSEIFHEEKDLEKWNLPSLKYATNDAITVIHGSHLDLQINRAIQAEKDLIAALDLLEEQIAHFNPKDIIDFLQLYIK